MQTNRRRAIAWLGAAGLAAAAGRGSAQPVARPANPFVTSDFAKLRRVVVCPPGQNAYALDRNDAGVFPTVDAEFDRVAENHAGLVRALRASGAEVLQVHDLLTSAISTARSRGVWETWLGTTYPRLAGEAKTIGADALLGRDPRFQFKSWDDGGYRHLADDLGAYTFTRDSVVTVPHGVMLMNLHAAHRVREQVLARFLHDFAPELRRYPVVVDFKREGLLAEGGDFQVVEENTLFVGVGNRTDPRVAPLLAKRLGMDVLAVTSRKADTLRTGEKRFLLRAVFLHLDTYFTHVGEKQALTLPWLLEAEHAETSPYVKALKSFGPDSQITEEDLKSALDYAKDLGKVRLFRAGSGEEDASVRDMKLVDYVRSKGYTVHWVGGERPDPADQLRHLFQAVMHEHRRQGANVVATGPGEIVAYAGAPRTHAALRTAGVKVTAFEARELWPWNGGPHCLTMPLERG